MKDITAATATKIKAEYERLKANMANDAQGMVTGGSDFAFQIGRAYRTLDDRYKERVCGKFSITPEILTSIVNGTFLPAQPQTNSVQTTAALKKWWHFWK